MSRIITTKPRPGAQVDWGNSINRDLVGWWPFHEGAGVGAGNLVSGNAGVLTNMEPAGDWVGSPLGGGLEFDGGLDRVLIPHIPAYDFALESFTIVIAFVKPVAANEKILLKSGTALIDFNFIGAGSSPRIIFRDTTGSPSQEILSFSAFDIGDGQFHTVAFGIDRGAGNIFIRGDHNQEITQATSLGAISNTGDINVGASEFIGIVDDMKIYKGRALQMEDVALLHRSPYDGVLRRAVRFVSGAAVITGAAFGVGLGLGGNEALQIALGNAHGVGVGTGKPTALQIALGAAEGLGIGTGLPIALQIAIGRAHGLGLGKGQPTALQIVLGLAEGLGYGFGAAEEGGSIVISLAIVSPVDTPLPLEPKEAVANLHERIRDLNEIVVDLVNSLFYETHVEPIRPRDGMIRRADGTNWNPGNGAGLYQRINGSWLSLTYGNIDKWDTP